MFNKNKLMFALVFVFGILIFVLGINVVDGFIEIDECGQSGGGCFTVERNNNNLIMYRGVCYDNKCVNFRNMELYLDPYYVVETEENRLFTPTSITPFDDVVCGVDVELPPAMHYPFNLLKGKLVTYGEDGKKVVVNEGIFNLVDSEGLYDDNGDVVGGMGRYEWKIQGWEQGLVTPNDIDKMEALIKDGRLRCEIVGSDGYTIENPFVEINVNKCVTLWGSDPKVSGLKHVKYVSMRGESAVMGPYDIINEGLGDMYGGFWEIDPFGSDVNVSSNGIPYKRALSYYVDLKEHDDGEYALKSSGYFEDSVYNLVPSVSSCGGDSRLYNFRTARGELGIPITPGVQITGGYTNFKKRTIFTRSGVPPKISVHETGHALCGLADEAVKPNQTVGFSDMLFNPFARETNGKNCRWPPGGFGQWGDNYEGCYFENFFKPSKMSLMNYYPDDISEFNTVSCGYCLKELQPQIGMTTHWQTCRDEMDTVEPGMECVASEDIVSADGSSGWNGRCGDIGCGACDAYGACDYNSNNGQECVKMVSGNLGFGTCYGGSCQIQSGWQCSYKFNSVNGLINGCPDGMMCETNHMCL